MTKFTGATDETPLTKIGEVFLQTPDGRTFGAVGDWGVLTAGAGRHRFSRYEMQPDPSSDERFSCFWAGNGYLSARFDQHSQLVTTLKGGGGVSIPSGDELFRLDEFDASRSIFNLFLPWLDAQGPSDAARYVTMNGNEFTIGNACTTTDCAAQVVLVDAF